MKKVLFFGLFLFPLGLLADAALPLAGAVSGLNSATGVIPSSLPAGLIMVLTFILSELGAHGVPTSKPISWFLGLSAVLGSVILLLQKVQNLFTILGTSVQNISAPAPTPAPAPTSPSGS